MWGTACEAEGCDNIVWGTSLIEAPGSGVVWSEAEPMPVIRFLLVPAVLR